MDDLAPCYKGNYGGARDGWTSGMIWNFIFPSACLEGRHVILGSGTGTSEETTVWGTHCMYCGTEVRRH